MFVSVVFWFLYPSKITEPLFHDPKFGSGTPYLVFSAMEYKKRVLILSS